MTFLNPFVLFGLLAAAIPVILHLLNLRKLRVVEFSTLRFLKELQQTKIRRLKFRQILLLILRTLIILAIVVAFARPALRGSIVGSIGANAHSTFVIILDDTFSMSVSDQHGERLRQAKDQSLSIVSLLNDGDEVFLIKLSDLPRATVEPATHDFQALRQLISEVKPTMIRGDVGDAMRLSARLLSQSSNVNKEIYVISDFQRTAFERQAEVEDMPMFDERVRVFTVPIGDDAISNTAVDSVGIATQIFERSKPVRLSLGLRNAGDATVQDNVVSVFFDNVRAAQSNAHLGSWGSTVLDLSATARRSGFVKGRAEMESDALDADNARHFSFYVPPRLRVALVASEASDLMYVDLALKTGSIDSAQSVLEIIQSTSDRFSIVDLKSVDVVILAGFHSMPPGSAERLRGFVESGGGVIFFPGTQSESSDDAFLSQLSVPPPSGLVGSPASPAGLSFKAMDVDHPLFATLFGELSAGAKRPAVESPLIAVSQRRMPGPNGSTIIGLNDGGTFLNEYNVGKGKLLLYSVAPDLEWSDFPLKGIFVPLMYRSVLYTGATGKPSLSATVGDDVSLSIPAAMLSVGNAEYTLSGPDGIEERLLPVSTRTAADTIQSTGGSIPLTPVRPMVPGWYELKKAGETLLIVSVNIDTRESDLRLMEEEDLLQFCESIGISRASVASLTRETRVEEKVLQARFGTELWKYCIILALILTLIEMLVARDSRKAAQEVKGTAS